MRQKGSINVLVVPARAGHIHLYLNYKECFRGTIERALDFLGCCHWPISWPRVITIWLLILCARSLLQKHHMIIFFKQH
jgi:hypothetical protein